MTRYTVSCRVHHSRDELFDLVADIERYPEFVPYLIATRADRSRMPELKVEMLFALGFVRYRIRSTGILHRPSRIDITSDDALFKSFAFDWSFDAIDRRNTQVTFHAVFMFRRRIWQRLFAARVLKEIGAMVDAFLQRADAQGKPLP